MYDQLLKVIFIDIDSTLYAPVSCGKSVLTYDSHYFRTLLYLYFILHFGYFIHSNYFMLTLLVISGLVYLDLIR